jgi:predicted ATP-dependent serine protease
MLDSDKRQAIQDIMQSAQQLRQQQQNESTEMGGDAGDGIMSASDLMNFKYNKYDFGGKWGDFVGQPSINFHAMVYGRPKQGKSILSVQWAKYLSENFGKVLYVASEEGFSVTLQKKVMEFAMDNPNLDFANFRDFEQIKNAVNRGGYRFVFIDSVNYIRITPEDVEDIKAENPQTAFITIQQATKNGNFRGSQEFAHNCDMVIRVEAGMASHQGRFQEPTEMAVFEDAEKPATKESPLMGGEQSGQMDMFSSADFGESTF